MTYQPTIFEQPASEPLAARLRPRDLDEFFGQEHLLGKGKVLRRIIENDQVGSMIFWGPPGVGKTTLARIIARRTKAKFIDFSAVTSGIKEIKQVMNEAENARRFGEKTILFVDEIHRFNKAQQDAFLPFVEKGSIILIGATTENPSFEVNAALLSRCKVFVLKALTEQDLLQLLQRALSDPRGFGGQAIEAPQELLEMLARFANGDARVALNLLEQAEFMLPDGVKTIDGVVLKSVMGDAFKRYDKKGDRHYDTVSAFIKSMRGSDADAALHYLAEMLESGEDVRFIARRIVICAAEDVGNADPMALVVANSAAQAAHFIGLPEAQLPLAQAVCYIANAPKSNACCTAIFSAREEARAVQSTVPKHLRDAHYPGAGALGHGTGYKYPHDYPGGWVQQQYMPDELIGHKYYFPKDIGAEKALHGK